MRTASIPLTLVVLLGLASAAGAAEYLLTVNEQQIGIGDFYYPTDPDDRLGETEMDTYIHLGPFTARRVPFNATQGFIGFCLIALALLALFAGFAVRWKKKRKPDEAAILNP